MSYLVQGCIGEEPVHWFIIANAVPPFIYIYINKYIYIYISKCHMKQILSRAPAAFFFHSYAYAQSISPAILRFALGRHDVTRT